MPARDSPSRPARPAPQQAARARWSPAVCRATPSTPLFTYLTTADATYRADGSSVSSVTVDAAGTVPAAGIASIQSVEVWMTSDVMDAGRGTQPLDGRPGHLHQPHREELGMLTHDQGPVRGGRGLHHARRAHGVHGGDRAGAHRARHRAQLRRATAGAGRTTGLRWVPPRPGSRTTSRGSTPATPTGTSPAATRHRTWRSVAGPRCPGPPAPTPPATARRCSRTRCRRRRPVSSASRSRGRSTGWSARSSPTSPRPRFLKFLYFSDFETFSPSSTARMANFANDTFTQLHQPQLRQHHPPSPRGRARRTPCSDRPRTRSGAAARCTTTRGGTRSPHRPVGAERYDADRRDVAGRDRHDAERHRRRASSSA